MVNEHSVPLFLAQESQHLLNIKKKGDAKM